MKSQEIHFKIGTRDWGNAKDEGVHKNWSPQDDKEGPS